MSFHFFEYFITGKCIIFIFHFLEKSTRTVCPHLQRNACFWFWWIYLWCWQGLKRGRECRKLGFSWSQCVRNHWESMNDERWHHCVTALNINIHNVHRSLRWSALISAGDLNQRIVTDPMGNMISWSVAVWSSSCKHLLWLIVTCRQCFKHQPIPTIMKFNVDKVVWKRRITRVARNFYKLLLKRKCKCKGERIISKVNIYYSFI